MIVSNYRIIGSGLEWFVFSKPVRRIVQVGVDAVMLAEDVRINGHRVPMIHATIYGREPGQIANLGYSFAPVKRFCVQHAGRHHPRNKVWIVRYQVRFQPRPVVQVTLRPGVLLPRITLFTIAVITRYRHHLIVNLLKGAVIRWCNTAERVSRVSWESLLRDAKLFAVELGGLVKAHFIGAYSGAYGDLAR